MRSGPMLSGPRVTRHRAADRSTARELGDLGLWDFPHQTLDDVLGAQSFRLCLEVRAEPMAQHGDRDFADVGD